MSSNATVRRAVVMIALLLAASATMLAPTTAGGHFEHTFSWKAPKNVTGVFALQVHAEPTGDGPMRCEGKAGGAGGDDGWSGDMEDPPVHFWTEMRFDDTTERAMVRNWETAEAHAGGLSTRTVFASNAWGWGLDVGFVDRVESRLTVTAAVFDGAWQSDPSPAIEVTIWCDEPFEVERFASRDARGFSRDGTTTGTGAGVRAAEIQASLSSAEWVIEEFDTDRVAFRAVSEVEGDDLAEERGRLDLDHPMGHETWELNGSLSARHEGGPGAYRVLINRLAVATPEDIDQHPRFGGDRFAGVLLGLDPVDRLDDAV